MPHSHIAVIPARANSRRIINKNITLLGNKYLIDWTIESAQKVGFFKKLIVSTDIPIILERKNTVPYEILDRDASIAADDTPMIKVIESVLARASISPYSTVWLLQPTSPFRSDSSFEIIRDVIETGRYQSVISLVDTGDSNPARMCTIWNGAIQPLRHFNFEVQHKLPAVFKRSGGFYVFLARDFLQKRSFFLDRAYGHIQDEIEGHNIDTPKDLLTAHAICDNLLKSHAPVPIEVLEKQKQGRGRPRKEEIHRAS